MDRQQRPHYAECRAGNKWGDEQRGSEAGKVWVIDVPTALPIRLGGVVEYHVLAGSMVEPQPTKNDNGSCTVVTSQSHTNRCSAYKMEQ